MTPGNHTKLKALLNEQRALSERLNAEVREAFPIGCVVEYALPGKVGEVIRGKVEKHKCQGSRNNITLLIASSYSPGRLLTKTVSDLNLGEIQIISLP